MRILLYLLALASAPACAEWVEVIKDDIATLYIDPATIRKNGSLRMVWTLQDLNQRYKEGGEMSRRALVEFDCKEERRRMISITSHSESKARGNILSTDSEASNWTYVPPNTLSAILLKTVCSK